MLCTALYIVIAGEDLYTFDDAVKPNTGSFYVRQIVGSTNYPTGSDPVDFSHGFLNYQVSKVYSIIVSSLMAHLGIP